MVVGLLANIEKEKRTLLCTFLYFATILEGRIYIKEQLSLTNNIEIVLRKDSCNTI